jgi:hypothetical protein
LGITNITIDQLSFTYGTGNIAVLIQDAQPILILIRKISRGAVFAVEMLLLEMQLHRGTAIDTVHLVLFGIRSTEGLFFILVIIPFVGLILPGSTECHTNRDADRNIAHRYSNGCTDIDPQCDTGTHFIPVLSLSHYPFAPISSIPG